ncbi:MAG TPA: TonB family protein, partial [Longimicrobium sp.]|nr:TonB family protein [Longimicrobium sp.]
MVEPSLRPRARHDGGAPINHGAGMMNRVRAAAVAAGVLLSLGAAPPASAQQTAGMAPPVEIYAAPAVDVQPRLMNGAAIGRRLTERYPPALLARRVSGAVLLRFRIQPDGSVDSVSAVQATDTAFVETALAVGRELVFTAARVGGRAVPIWQTFDLRFLPTPRTGYDAGDRQPVLRNGAEVDRLIAARYPPDQLAGKVRGTVLLRFMIRTDGRVDSASVLPLRATNAAFVEPAAAVVRRLAFTPAKVSGQPVAYWHSFDILFRPPGQPTPPPAQGADAGAEAPPPPPSSSPDEGTYELSAVEEQPRLRNGTEVARQIAASFPSTLPDSVVAGRVVLRFRIQENGRVDSATVSVVQATNPAFAETAMAVARQMRFTPARTGGRG